MSPIKRLLIANRGEIALRIARTAADMGVETVAVHPEDDAASLHVIRADMAELLPGRGARAYLDVAEVVAAGQRSGCDAMHPGYGFLSENAAFAAAAEAAGMRFVGPTPESLSLYGDKVAARKLADECGVPVLPGTADPVDAAGAAAFWDTLPGGAAMIVKAVAGGGGRGMRLVRDASEIEASVAAAAREAEAAFGSAEVYVERFVETARHIEVQVLGDGAGGVMTLGERDCTLQRRHQKVLEIAPAPDLAPETRSALLSHAETMARAGDYRSLGTFEFLLDRATGEVFFIEANPRIQVEHTITEAVHGIDLVAQQLRIASGATLAELAIDVAPRGYAIQARVNMERMNAKGDIRPSGGKISAYDPPAGPGVRVDGFAYAGYTTSAAYDSLLAKVIVQGPDFASTIAKTSRALSEFRIAGLETNASWLRALLGRAELPGYNVSTRFIEAHAKDLAEAAVALPVATFGVDQAGTAEQTGAKVPEGETAVPAPMQATVISLNVEPGDSVAKGTVVAVLEAMKMEHTIESPVSGRVGAVLAKAGETLMEGAPILSIAPGEVDAATTEAEETVDLDAVRPDLQELLDHKAKGQDAARPDKVAKRHKLGQRTARENIADLIDEGSFNEYGELAIAAQSKRRTREDLEANTSGDGLLTGTATINAGLFGPEGGRVALAIGDYTVLAGTQGQRHHRKLDRILNVAGRHKLPLVFFAEGGGGRPGDTDRVNVAGLDGPSFRHFAALSGKVPVVGVVSGRCFAGNAALLGCCDVIIATEDSNIGMAGPAMIEGGGLGVYTPEEVGPIDVQWGNGNVDIRVKDEAEACAAAKQYISYFQGPVTDWTAPDQRLLRRAIPENRLRSYEVRDVIHKLCDEGSVLELRQGWGPGMVTCLVRIEGRPYGLIANNPKHLGGAIDADAGDKAARFLQLCDSHGLPVISLCDTPGFMVGPEAEKTSLVRHVCRMFVVGAQVSVPLIGIVLRKGYGLGAMAMIGGGFKESALTVTWPTGEFGGMGLEGAVHLGFRKELAAVEDPAEKQALFDKLLANFYDIGKAVNYAAAIELDAVIDPMETRRWIVNAITAAPPTGGTGRFVDSW
ncbi:carbamoyl-phosphate synthase large subunit [Oceanicola sp. 22II-s10i]|uniref:acetyl-CoA carboxylase family protein n=1 Tax=Oceanicola sp. 22II-s10i TaxID=1317116 RepID=UPI000B646E3F|nr:carboxyl transferase domain-containing protein [Oceanicola sp. 22II-s10i]OWU85519.1 carbamoyl-phosphate synthase large subunit [Oceanicola sp. 22II-s10i]